MAGVREKVERFFGMLAYYFYNNPLKTLLCVFLFLGVLIYQIPKITVDTSSKSMFRQDDPSMVDYNAFLDQFGRSGVIVVAIKPQEIFDSKFLEKLKALHQDLETRVPYLKGIISLINARKTVGKENALVVESLLQGWPEKEIDLTSIKKEVMENPFYSNFIISGDGRLATVVLEIRATKGKSYAEDKLLENFDTDASPSEDVETDSSDVLTVAEIRKVVDAVRDVTRRYESPDFPLFVSGWPVISDVYNKSVLNDMIFCLSVGTIAVGVSLFFFFRRISGVILPAVVVELAILCTLGLMALFGAPITEVTMVIPAFLLSVCIADSIHILSVFYMYIDQQGKSKEDAIVYSLGHSGIKVVLSSLTTAGGLLSFTTAELTAVSEMGQYSGAGVMIALILTVVMLPPLLSVLPIKMKEKTEKRALPIIDRALQFFTDVSTGHPRKIIIISLIAFIISFAFVFKLKFSYNFLDYFPDTMSVKKDTIYLDRELGGITSIEAVVDTGRENGVQDPEILNRIEKFSAKLREMKHPEIFVGKVFSINDILKECHQALHENNPDYYKIPQNRETIAQEFLLFETSGSDDLSMWVDSQFSKTRISAKTPAVDALVYEGFIEEVKSLAKDIFGDTAKVTITGSSVLIARTIPVALRSMAKSYMLSFFVVTVITIFLLGSFKIGLLSMLPNTFPIIMVMGIMGGMGTHLNLATLMMGNIAIGIVVDDTVHFISNFQGYYDKIGDAYQAILETFLSSGRALLISALILAGGFFVLMLASLSHMVTFGFYTGITILVAMIYDFFLTPALMFLVKGGGKKLITQERENGNIG